MKPNEDSESPISDSLNSQAPENKSLTDSRSGVADRLHETLFRSEAVVALVHDLGPNMDSWVCEGLQTSLKKNPACGYIMSLHLDEGKDPIDQLRNLLCKTVTMDAQNLQANEPERWARMVSSSLRGGQVGASLLTVENLDAILTAPWTTQCAFAEIICHLSCEIELAVLVGIEKKAVGCIATLPGFWFLSSAPAGVHQVPGFWAPPLEDAAKDGQPPRHSVVEDRAKSKSSQVYLALAAMISIALVVTSLFVERRATRTARKVAARMDIMNVTSPLEVAWNQTPTDSFQSNPIPVSLVADSGSLPADIGEPHSYLPVVSEVDGSEVSDADAAPRPVTIPEWAEHSTEDRYLESLLSFESLPYELIGKSGSIDAGRPADQETIMAKQGADVPVGNSRKRPQIVKIQPKSASSDMGVTFPVLATGGYSTGDQQTAQVEQDFRAHAAFRLGSSQLFEARAESDYHLALKNLHEARRQYHSDADYLIGICYLSGLGVEVSHSRAFVHFAAAVDGGSIAACREAGRMSEIGMGTSSDMALAVKFYRKGADRGDPYCRAKLQESGISVDAWAKPPKEHWLNAKCRGLLPDTFL